MKADHGFKFMAEKNIPHHPTYLPEHNLANLKASAILFFWDRSMKGAPPLFCSCQLILPLGTTPPYYPPPPVYGRIGVQRELPHIVRLSRPAPRVRFQPNIFNYRRATFCPLHRGSTAPTKAIRRGGGKFNPFHIMELLFK